ncbi:MAG: hypothetical protein EZS28_007303, partial [Streblomastix strix]
LHFVAVESFAISTLDKIIKNNFPYTIIIIYAAVKNECVSILAVLGMLHIVVDRARQAKRDGKEYGGSFMIFGETELEQEDNEVTLRRKVELIYKAKENQT